MVWRRDRGLARPWWRLRRGRGTTACRCALDHCKDLLSFGVSRVLMSRMLKKGLAGSFEHAARNHPRTLFSKHIVHIMMYSSGLRERKKYFWARTYIASSCTFHSNDSTQHFSRLCPQHNIITPLPRNKSIVLLPSGLCALSRSSICLDTDFLENEQSVLWGITFSRKLLRSRIGLLHLHVVTMKFQWYATRLACVFSSRAFPDVI
jgi:hypothetical protein